MIKNYWQVALRNLRRYKFFSFINIFGLAISMALCLGIIMLVADQMTYDRYNSKRDRVFRIVTRPSNADGSGSGNEYATSPQPLAQAIREDYPGVEKTVRIRRGFGNNWIEMEPGRDINIPVSGFFADPDALDVFEYELEQGDAKTALREPYSVVLTKKAAKKLFTKEQVVGEVLKVGKLGDYKVTGVIRESLNKSHIVFDGLASYATIKSLEADSTLSKAELDWDNFTAGWVYALVEKGHRAKEIEQNLNKIAQNHNVARKEKDEKTHQYYLQNISSITPGAFINNPIGPFMPAIFVYFFGGLALIVMLTSCFNFTNLSLARSLTRSREIGVRKVNGASRFQIFGQFITEAVLLSLFSLVLAIIMLICIKPFILDLKFAQVLRWDLEGNVFVYGVFVLFSVVVGILAGFFPAVVLSKFQPVKVLKSSSSMKLFSRMGLRKSLLVGQFALSLIFILSVLVLYNQLDLFMTADHGFDMSRKINVRLSNTSYESLRNELSNFSNIESVSASSHVPASGVTYGDGFKRNLADAESRQLDYFSVDENYLVNMNIPLIAGQMFQPQALEKNKRSLVINEVAVEKFDLKNAQDAIGETLYLEQDSTPFEVIGVVKNYNHQMMISSVEPMALRFDPEQFNLLQVKYRGEHAAALKSIETVWAKVNPGIKLDYKNFDDEIKLIYELLFSDLVKVIGVMAFLAIAISCLGLLGMATYTTETRMKEISIRKILGSDNKSLVILLSKSFISVVIIAVVLAVPIAWFINTQWLQLIAYRTEIGFGVIGLGVMILLLLGCITIGSQTLRACFTNPVNNLKND
jgi:putative ABC transport system permease protein